MVTDLRADIAVKLLRCVKHLTRDPSMLLPLYVRHNPTEPCAASLQTLNLNESTNVKITEIAGYRCPLIH